MGPGAGAVAVVVAAVAVLEEYSAAVRLEVIVGAQEADNQEEEGSRYFAVVRGG